MNWWVNVKQDWGMGQVTETESKYTTAAYDMVQEAVFEACTMPGDYCKVSVTARNRAGMTLMMEGMGWSREGLSRFEDACFRASEQTNREERA